MTGIDNYSIQATIKQFAIDNINWYVTSGNVPDAKSLRYNDGVLDPYVIIRFSGMLPTSRGYSFNGALYDEYYSYFDVLCVAATDDEARELASVVDRLMIGKTFPNTGEMRVQAGGGLFAISLDTQHPLAFIAINAYRYSLNELDVGAGSISV